MLWKAGVGVFRLVVLMGKGTRGKLHPWWVCEVQPVPEHDFEDPIEVVGTKSSMRGTGQTQQLIPLFTSLFAFRGGCFSPVGCKGRSCLFFSMAI